MKKATKEAEAGEVPVPPGQEEEEPVEGEEEALPPEGEEEPSATERLTAYGAKDSLFEQSPVVARRSDLPKQEGLREKSGTGRVVMEYRLPEGEKDGNPPTDA